MYPNTLFNFSNYLWNHGKAFMDFSVLWHASGKWELRHMERYGYDGQVKTHDEGKCVYVVLGARPAPPKTPESQRSFNDSEVKVSSKRR